MNDPSIPSFARPTFLAAALLLAVSASAATSYWDTSATAGLQSGDGTWGVDNFWSATTAGTSLGAWSSGNVAEFRTQSYLSNTVTVSGSQVISGMTFTSAINGPADWRFQGTGDLVLGAGSTIVNTGNGKVTIDSTISGSKMLTVSSSSAGRLILTGMNTYTGGTNVESGTLQVDGRVAGQTTALLGGNLTGSGVFGDVLVADKGSLNAGTPQSVGTMTMDTLTLHGGATVYWDLANAVAAAGSGYDRLNVLGRIDLGGLSLGSKLKLALVGNPLVFDATKSARFAVFVYGSLSVGFNAGFSDMVTFDTSGLKDGSGASVAADRFTLIDNAATKTLDLVYTAPIPEPSTYGLGLGALGLAIAMVRRRRAQRAV